MNTAVRSVRTTDPLEMSLKKIIFVEPAQYPDTLPFGGGKVFPVGFDEATPIGQDLKYYQALNDHSYCCSAKASVCTNPDHEGVPALSDSKMCRDYHF